MIKEIQVTGVFTTNSYLFIDEHTLSGFLIDPGAQANRIYDAVSTNGWNIEKILLTHGHFDHIGAAEVLSKAWGTPIYIHASDAQYLVDPYLNLSENAGVAITISNYKELHHDDIIRLPENPDFYLRVIHTPGHTPGSVTFYTPQERAAFVGDLLYQHGAGLTNFPGGNRSELEHSIVEKALTLPSDTVLLSGHSSPITVSEERKLLLNAP